MLRRRLLISVARASRTAGRPGALLGRLAIAGARALARPDAMAPSNSTRLDDLPLVVLDCETTGLDPARDRIVSLAALRLIGTDSTPRAMLDLLIDPGMPIPARATAIHGITDAMVFGAPSFAAAVRSLRPLLRGAVLVGHAVGFDRAMLVREARRAGVPWRQAPSLCTRELAAALLPARADVELDALAARFDVALIGRHTALGDARITAEVFAVLSRLAIRSGVATLGALRALAEQGARRLAYRRAHGH
jgi:DNA polymerase-3 subunit epsilon